MAREVVMPQMGLSMESGKISQWLKASGDKIGRGEVLLEVESDKATIQVEAVESGTLQILAGTDAGDIRVGTVIGYILGEGESLPAPNVVSTSPAQLEAPAAGDKSGGKLTAQKMHEQSRRRPSTPLARRRANELGIDWTHAVPSGSRGQIKERDILKLSNRPLEESAPQPALDISPVARNLAESLGLEPAVLSQMFPGRRIERADVEQAVRRIIAGQSAAAPGVRAASAGGAAADHRYPMTHLRRMIADRMAHSAHTTAPVTLTTEADATDLVRLRESLKMDVSAGITPSYNVILAKLVAFGLMEHPDLNATMEGDDIVQRAAVNIGIAVDTERGLVVPVLRDVQSKTLRQLAVEADALLTRASRGRAVPDELTGGTFTITNLGSFEIDAFSPIINAPECAVLGVGRLIRKLVVTGGDAAVVRTMLALSLTFDHRLVDGAPAARFLQRVKQFVEQPSLWLTRDTNP